MLDFKRMVPHSLSMRISRYLLSRRLQSWVHSRKFPFRVQLSDGSITEMTTLTYSPNNSIAKLLQDSLSHPSWNPHCRNEMLNEMHANIQKFQQRYQNNISTDDSISNLFAPKSSTISSKPKSLKSAKK